VKRACKWIGTLLLVALIALFSWGYAPDTDPAAMKAKYANAASQFLDVGGGLVMHVRDEGKRDGPVLVLLHGSNSSLHTWQPWAARLGGKYRVITLDQIGHGLTGPNPTGQYDAAAFVGTLDALLTKLGVSRFTLAGNSMGGWVAWEYALAHPDKLTHLVLLDSAGPPDDPRKSLSFGFMVQQTPYINLISRFITPRPMVESSYRSVVADPKLATAAKVDRTWQLIRYPGNRQATLDIIAARSTQRQHVDRLGSIRVPTLILWGERDTNIAVSGADWFAARIPGAIKIVYPAIGHLPMEEAPERSAADVDAFLSKPFPSPAKPPSIALVKP
jgi:pimeloyl-ACP methyl ester carboxylesterase